MSQKYWYLIGGILIGLVAGPQLRKLPVVSKLPVGV
jgi:hypothetical protein